MISRLLVPLRPRGGWAPFMLLLLALLSLPAATISGAKSPDLSLLVLAAAAVVVGFWMARSRLSGRLVGLIGAASGLLIGTADVGRLLPPLPLLWADLVQAAGWIAALLRGTAQPSQPFARSIAYLWQQANTLGLRLWWWLQRSSAGGEAQDTIVLQLLSAFLVWVLGLFATWQIYRRREALAGLLPTGTVLAIVTFFRRDTSPLYLALFLFCTLWLMSTCHLWRRRDDWERKAIDHPGDLGLELAIALSPWLIPLLLVASVFPIVRLRPLREAFWQVMDAPWSQVERGAERFLGPIDDLGPGRPGGRVGQAGELPSAHLLGGSPELGTKIVLLVSTNDAPPPRPDDLSAVEPADPRRYWRSRTFDTYTGRGWTNGPLAPQPLESGQTLYPTLTAGPGLIQQVQRLDPGSSLVFAANAPLRLDQPVDAWWRDPGDLAQLTGKADLYTVLSLPPEPTVVELRAHSPTGAGLPENIAGRYLTLDDSIPRRVLDLAQRVAGTAPTRYDQVRAIEQFLRSYPYNLEIPAPPSNRDLVDYFLFELQEGYCDYYASAMVVMARAVGVPARLASGYAQGTYDPAASRWVVTEENGHSWVEVYFDGIGWVEFEPTAGLAALERPGGRQLAAPEPPPLPPRHTRWWQAIPWALLFLGAAVASLLTLVLWLWRPRRIRSAAGLVIDRHARLLRWGARLRHPLRDGQTPHEYGRDLAAGIRSRGQRAPLPRARRAARRAPPEIERLSAAYVRVRYSPHHVPDHQGRRARGLWSRLRRHLWWLWLGSRPGARLAEPPSDIERDAP